MKKSSVKSVKKGCYVKRLFLRTIVLKQNLEEGLVTCFNKEGKLSLILMEKSRLLLRTNFFDNWVWGYNLKKNIMIDNKGAPFWV